MSPPASPRTGDIYWADLNPTIGSEQRGDRPVIVFQNPAVGRFTSTVLVVPITTSVRRLGLPGTCGLPAGAGALPADSVALAYQMRAIDRQRLRGRRHLRGRADRLQAPARVDGTPGQLRRAGT